MSERLTPSRREERGVARRRQIRRRRLAVLLSAAGLVGVVLIVWAAAGQGSSGGSATSAPSHASTGTTGTASVGTTSAGTTSTGMTSTGVAATIAASGGPAHVRPMVAYPRTTPPWTNPSRWTGQPPAVLLTRLTTDNAGDKVTIAWFNQSRTVVGLYPGYKNPVMGGRSVGPTKVPLTGRRTVVATFNSGFFEKDDPAGFYAHGTLYHAMVYGKATLVEHSDGTVDIVRWTGGARPGPNIIVARQNLGMLVNSAHVGPTAGILSDWGLTWKGAYAVWRSALGVDKNGNLIYAAGPNQSVRSIATALIHAGAVRAMQLDINPYWPILVTFGAPGAHLPTLVTPNPNQIPGRFLQASEKDFFTVSLRTGTGTVKLPW
jgi:hypothetical protein